MSEPKFTKGPWHVSENQPTVVGNKEKAVCKCELDWNLGANERKANAALIAAAPEMYDLLQKVVNLEVLTGYWDMKNNCPLRESIQKLLKKARGEE
jgi:hypothetical protein